MRCISSLEMCVYKIKWIPHWLEQTQRERVGRHAPRFVPDSSLLKIQINHSPFTGKGRHDLAEGKVPKTSQEVVQFDKTSVGFWFLLSNSCFLSRLFFQSACDVPEPEERFNIDEYSDMVTLSKPIIYISIEEIINTHSVHQSTKKKLFLQMYCMIPTQDITNATLILDLVGIYILFTQSQIWRFFLSQRLTRTWKETH